MAVADTATSVPSNPMASRAQKGGMALMTVARRLRRPRVRLLMAVPVVCWILFSVLWFKWVEFRIAFVLIDGIDPLEN